METIKKLPQGFSIGHENDEYTGVTAIICSEGAIGGVDVRGGAPGTHETDLLRNEKMMQKINAVALCGGSAFGMGAITGIMKCLHEKGVGYPIDNKVVPIVCGAVIYDLNDAEYHYPTAESGYKAASRATSDDLRQGKVGVGVGATVGKILGMSGACPSGIGIAGVRVGNALVTAIVCVNALGDVTDPKTGKIVAGAKANGQFIDTKRFILENVSSNPPFGTNTTIGCVVTDAKITKVQANKLASVAHNGLARTISPVHTDFDGDALFCLSSCKEEADFFALEIAVTQAVEQAVLNAVK